jgi:hypothetical protein
MARRADGEYQAQMADYSLRLGGQAQYTAGLATHQPSSIGPAAHDAGTRAAAGAATAHVARMPSAPFPASSPTMPRDNVCLGRGEGPASDVDMQRPQQAPLQATQTALALTKAQLQPPAGAAAQRPGHIPSVVGTTPPLGLAATAPLFAPQPLAPPPQPLLAHATDQAAPLPLPTKPAAATAAVAWPLSPLLAPPWSLLSPAAAAAADAAAAAAAMPPPPPPLPQDVEEILDTGLDFPEAQRALQGLGLAPEAYELLLDAWRATSPRARDAVRAWRLHVQGR